MVNYRYTDARVGNVLGLGKSLRFRVKVRYELGGRGGVVPVGGANAGSAIRVRQEAHRGGGMHERGLVHALLHREKFLLLPSQIRPRRIVWVNGGIAQIDRARNDENVGNGVAAWILRQYLLRVVVRSR